MLVNRFDSFADISVSPRRRKNSLSIANFSKDYTLPSDVPIFATSKSRFKYSHDLGEKDMMDNRWKVFES